MPRARRICPRPGCAKPAEGRYCTAHNREYERARGTRQDRGYGVAHQQLRTRWAALVAAGNVACVRCGRPIAAGQPWHLDHDDEDRNRYLGPAHARCNNAAGGRRAHQTE